MARREQACSNATNRRVAYLRKVSPGERAGQSCAEQFFRVWVFWLIVLSAALPLSGRADEVDEVMRERVEAMRGEAPVTVAGQPIAARSVLAELYERHDFVPLWRKPESVAELLQAIEESRDDGLDPEDYLLHTLQNLHPPGADDAPAVVDRDILLSDAFVRLAYHVRFGKVDPAALDPNWNFSGDLEPTGDHYAAVLRALDEGHVRDFIDGLKPKQPLYRNLKATLVDYRRIAAAGGWKSVASGPPLKPGMHDARIPAVRSRLAVTGDLAAADASATSLDYDDKLVAAVKVFQERHTLPADGTLGASTIKAMNVPVQERIDQIRATLERCRWVMHDLPDRFVLVNIAAFTAYLMENGGPVWDTAVVVGTPYTKTPVFRADMTYVVINPTWTVPASIVRKEIRPGMRRDRRYLEKKGMQEVDGQIVQKPGARNALGRIKLMFPNPHSVYLHDTPSKSYFNETTRTFSHGCVRVQKPFELAERVLDDPQWSTQAILDQVATGKTRTVRLKRPIPVLLLYWTATVRDGRTYFLPDVYGRDARIIRGLKGEFTLLKLGRRASR